MKHFIKYYLFIFITLLILLHPDSAIGYARSSLALCNDILCPSLFPFFVCSGLLVYSGFAECMAGFFEPVMRPLFKVSGNGAAAFVLGIISGYPIGAEVACRLWENGSISKNECERLLAFCNNSGPLFILGAVGVSIYHSPKIGAMLYFVHILAALTVGIILRFAAKPDTKKALKRHPVSDIPISEVFSKALQGSVKSILTICGTVIFFAVVSNLIADLIPKSLWRTAFAALSELTFGMKSISDLELSEGVKIILSAAAAGFAGFSVHLQVMGVINSKKLSLKLYIFGKILHAVISALYMYILLKIFPVTRTVFATGASFSGAFFAASVFTVGSVLILLAVIFIDLLVRVIQKNTADFRHKPKTADAVR